MRIIDSMRDFIIYWKDYSGKNPEEVFHGWINNYASRYPELLIFEAAYWRDLDRLQAEIMRVLGRIDAVIHDLIEAWMTTLQSLEDVYSAASRRLGFPREPIFAIYVGSGWKSRWIASILDEAALFIGLGALATLKWIDQRDVRGVLAFGLGQLRQAMERGGAERYAELEENPYFRLYSQGLAQFLEKLILAEDSWHGIAEEDWAEECRRRMGELAASYLDGARKGLVDQFYSPYQSVKGLSFAGRYLGYELIRKLSESRMGLNQLLGISESEVVKISKEFLERLSGR
ncbi:MAG: hypothetical protein QXM84_00665 [Nitrososphaerota archaeon]